MARVMQCYSCSHHPLSVNTTQHLLNHLQWVPGKAWSSRSSVEGEGDWEGDVKKVMAWLRLQIFRVCLFVCLFISKKRFLSRSFYKGKTWKWSATWRFQGATSRWNEYGRSPWNRKGWGWLLGQMPTSGRWGRFLVLFTSYPTSS